MAACYLVVLPPRCPPAACRNTPSRWSDRGTLPRLARPRAGKFGSSPFILPDLLVLLVVASVPKLPGRTSRTLQIRTEEDKSGSSHETALCRRIFSPPKPRAISFANSPASSAPHGAGRSAHRTAHSPTRYSRSMSDCTAPVLATRRSRLTVMTETRASNVAKTTPAFGARRTCR